VNEFRFCAHCSWIMRLPDSEDVDLVVFVGVKGFLCELVLNISECSKQVVVLHRWLYRVSFKERMFLLELKSKELEAEDERVMDVIDRIRETGVWEF